jgi:hypothetical protein
MSYQTPLASSFNNTKNRSPRLSPQSGMCSFCTEDCAGTCELALAAVLGAQTVYPTTTGTNQIGGEKEYPIDYSHFNINGRVFGAQGVRAEYNEATIFNVGLERTYGRQHPVKMALPIVLPALIKLNWEDYFGGAAMAGVTCMVGEDAKSKDPGMKMEKGKIREFPMLEKIVTAFKRYERGFGQIVLQSNVEDDFALVPEYALAHGVRALEFKFGQGAKGTQPVLKIKDLETALKKQANGVLVHPDPSAPDVQKAYAEGVCPNFYSYGRLPLWDETYLTARFQTLRELGAQNIYLKMAGYDRRDLERVLRLASTAGVDMVTYDGAGGGSGYSPCKMMNEWSLPTLCMEDAVVTIAKQMKKEGLYVPGITITGGLASEDQVFKALAYGDGLVTAIGLCRASMAAAMCGKKIGEQIKAGNTPELFKKYGATIEEIFADLPDLRALYGRQANEFSPGAIGVFSYLNKIALGLRHFAALNRKFDVSLLDKSDLIALTADARELISGRWFEGR